VNCDSACGFGGRGAAFGKCNRGYCRLNAGGFKGYADVEAAHAEIEVNVGKVQEARKTVEVTEANVVNAEDVDAEATESAIGSDEARKSRSTAKIAKAEGINASPRSKATESTVATLTAIGETAPPNEVTSADTKEVDATPEEHSSEIDVNTVQTAKAGITEAPKPPEELVASATPINQAVATAGNFPKTMEEAGGEAVATSSDNATQPPILAEGEVTALVGKLSSPEKETPAETEAASPFNENRLPALANGEATEYTQEKNLSKGVCVEVKRLLHLKDDPVPSAAVEGRLTQEEPVLGNAELLRCKLKAYFCCNRCGDPFVNCLKSYAYCGWLELDV
jgi:hypothetical protein